MKPIDPNDFWARQEISSIQQKYNSLLNQAKEKKDELFSTLKLYEEALSHTLYVGRSLNVRIINEPADFDLRQRIMNKINDLKSL